ncbi:MAG TPA: GNAT family N-acetyltransferase [Actinomycetota bacterium]|nr:GNAT family N-acetyltransferase [Actinomycetota bacterium]
MAIRELASIEEMRAAAELIDGIWGETRIVTPELLRAIATHGGLVVGAYRGKALVGAQMAFLGMSADELVLHSHVTGVAPGERGTGIGRALKIAQRDWCLARGIATVTWTFDPMIGRNAAFNLRSLGAEAVAFLPDFYGPMNDAFNAGDRTDRLEVRWELSSERVEAALSGRASAPTHDGRVLLADHDGSPRPEPLGDADEPVVRVQIPGDYLALRARDPELARRWRTAAGEAFGTAMNLGFRAVWFDPPATYVLERR